MKGRSPQDHTSEHDELRDRIVDHLNTLPFADFEVSEVGSRAGRLDITGCYRGRYVCFDVKTGNAKPTKLQAHEALRKVRAGALVGFVKTFEEAMELVGRII